jgi:hypothetical protein
LAVAPAFKGLQSGGMTQPGGSGSYPGTALHSYATTPRTSIMAGYSGAHGPLRYATLNSININKLISGARWASEEKGST